MPILATKEILRYRTALLNGYNELKNRPLTTRMAEEMCSLVKGVDMTVRKGSGTTLRNSRTREIIYTPPTGRLSFMQMMI